MNLVRVERFPPFHVAPHGFSPDSATLARVDGIWNEEKKKRGDSLFNGQFFSVLDMKTGAGFFTEYRFWLAQRCDPALKPILNLLPLAVTGILQCRDGYLFGQRTDTGQWELFPAGGVDDGAWLSDGRVDVEKQILTELAEETGIPAATVRTLDPWGWVIDEQEPLVDLVLTLETDLEAAAVLEFFTALRTTEHDRIEIVPRSALTGFVGANGNNMVATLMPIVQEMLSGGGL